MTAEAEQIRAIWKRLFHIDVKAARQRAGLPSLEDHLRFLEMKAPGASPALKEATSYEKRPLSSLSHKPTNYSTLIPNRAHAQKDITHMKISEAFPSNFLKVDDLGGKRLKLTIKSVSMEEVGDAQKPVVFFREHEKGLVLNKTNAAMIEEITGSDEMDHWARTQIILYPARVDFQGKRVPAIRVEEPAKKTAPAAASDEGDDVPY
jgi:hypothetical protein